MQLRPEKIGPTVAIGNNTQSLRCTLCKYLKQHLLKSGMDPHWQSECTHPSAFDTYIGENHDETPSWCPELASNKRGETTCPGCLLPVGKCVCTYGDLQ